MRAREAKKKKAAAAVSVGGQCFRLRLRWLRPDEKGNAGTEMLAGREAVGERVIVAALLVTLPEELVTRTA